jgi:PAS domain S-box-containing protein
MAATGSPDRVAVLAWACDGAGGVERANSDWTTYTGLPLTTCFKEGWAVALPEGDREAQLDAWRAAFQRAEATELELSLISAQGDARPFSCRVVPLIGGGQALSWIALLVEICDGGARELAEKSLRVRELARRAASRMDTANRFFAVNDELCSVVGRSPEQLIGSPVFDLVHPEDARPTTTRIERRRKNLAGEKELDVRLIHRDGRPITVHSIAHVLLTPEGAYDGGVSVLREVTDRERAVAVSHRHEVSHRLLHLHELERRRIARELHDQLGQLLTAVRISLDAFRVRCPPDARHQLDESLFNVDDAIRQVRNLSLELRPSMLDDLGLDAALRWYVDRQSQAMGIPIHTSLKIERRMDAGQETACFRIIQEAIANALRHASAQHLWLAVTQTAEGIELVVRDDGSGFDVEHARQCALHGASLGILGMHERALLAGGRLDIDSACGQGTEVRAQIPAAPPGEP